MSEERNHNPGCGGVLRIDAASHAASHVLELLVASRDTVRCRLLRVVSSMASSVARQGKSAGLIT